MANYVEQSEGQETKSYQVFVTNSDLEEWLVHNRLQKLRPYFRAEDADLDDIKTYNDAMIELRYATYTCFTLLLNMNHSYAILLSQIWEEERIQALNLGVVYLQRFKRAVRTLQAERGLIEVNEYSASPKMFDHLLSPQEQETMNTLQSTLNAVTAALRQNEEKQNHLDSEQKEKESAIDGVFDMIRNALSERQSKLKHKLNQIFDAQREALQFHSINLRKRRDFIIEGLKQQNAMIMNSINSDAKGREDKMEDIVKNTMIDFDDGGLDWRWRPIELVFHRDQMSKVISLICISTNSFCPLFYVLTTK